MFSTIGILGVLFGSMACDEPLSDAERYRRIVAGEETDLDRAFASCAEISTPSARGDCSLFVATHGARKNGEILGARCDRVAEGTWRFECWFQASESHRRERRIAEAAEACRRSGPFLDDCGQHLWQTALRNLRRDGGTEEFRVSYGAAENLYDQWAPLLAESTDFRIRFWRRYFGDAFHNTPEPLSVTACDPLPERGRERCLDVAAEVLVSRVRQAAGGETSRLCDEPSSLAEFADRFPGINLTLAPLFDEVYADEVARVCEQGGELPPPPIEGNLPPLPR